MDEEEEAALSLGSRTTVIASVPIARDPLIGCGRIVVWPVSNNYLFRARAKPNKFSSQAALAAT